MTTAQIFDASFAERDKVQRANHGKPWEAQEYLALKFYFSNGETLEQMCNTMGRPARGVLPKLFQLELIFSNGSGTVFRQIPTQIKEDSMERSVEKYGCTSGIADATSDATPAASPAFETRHFIHGREAASMTDAYIFNLIGRKEDEINRLNRIHNKPAKLVAAIEALQSEIDQLVKYVDARS